MGRKWRNGEQFRPLFEVFLKKIGFWVVDVWGAANSFKVKHFFYARRTSPLVLCPEKDFSFSMT
jgi:hypothetical protein